MPKFQKISLISGWLVFAIALVTYILTLEPAASLWDCSEFIATSYKLEVGHPPGTPLFFLINRFGAMFAGDPTNVAYAMNALSAIESALTIALLFWSIVMLGRMTYRRTSATITDSQNWSLIAAGAIGSLAYAFTDSFWFSAVESEVYALSSLFTAVVFWAILKWETIADQPHSNRWLILIAYLMGLSIGAHILNLLAIPALVFVYYFKRFPQRPKLDLWKPGAVAILLTGAFYMMTPTVVSIGAFIDYIFVNSFSLPVNTGLVTLIVILLAALGYLVWWSHKNARVTVNMICLSAIMVIIGFSSYGVVLIRSAVNPPMDSNNPENPYALKSFLNREQYGSRPLFKGQVYSSPVIDNVFSDNYRIDKDGKYEMFSRGVDYVYDPNTTTLFPRMYDGHSQNGRRYIPEYKNWGKVTGRQVRATNGEMVTVPTFGENMRFFFNYQVNHMYMRYFLWNFVGRQSDIQSTGNIDNGQWMSGITPLDQMYLGPQDNLPDEMAANKGRNHYYFLPFILGLVGLFFHLKRDSRGFLVVFMLFFMTGLAIVMYLNQTPLQPRERDYAYVGSFYAFAIWIGLGLLPIFEIMARKIKPRVALIATTVVCATVPTVLAVQNWDDHDRSKRTIGRDMGLNYLNSTLPNAILINYGDNDTFPVWYAQEVEGVRTDVRPMNFSYIGGDWYIDQMQYKANESERVPFTLPRDKYLVGKAKSFPVQEIPHPGGGAWTVQEVMSVINSDDPATKVYSQDGTAYDFVPSARIAVPVNKKNAIASGILRAEQADQAPDTIYIQLRDKQLDVTDVLFLDLLANTDWKRPLYFSSYGDLLKYGLVNIDNKNPENSFSHLQIDGMAYLLTPFKTPITSTYSVGRVDTKRLYDNLMNTFSYGNVADPDVYVDAFVHNTLGTTRIRSTFAKLADQLMIEGDTVRAVEVLDRAMKELPTSKLRYDEELIPIIQGYWNAGEKAKGNALANDYARNEAQYIDYFSRFTGNKAQLVDNIVYQHLINLYMVVLAASDEGYTEITTKYMPYLDQFLEPKPQQKQAAAPVIPSTDTTAR